MKVCEYVPHGAVPDVRGFAPAIVAQNFAKFLKEDTYIISAAESYVKQSENSEYGDVYRIKQSELYKKLFTKITRLDPYPLYARAAKIVNKHPVDIFHAHQLEFEVDFFRKKLDIKPKIVLHVHAVRSFIEKNGIADKYVACSEYTKRRLIEEKGYPKELVDVVYNGANVDIFSPPSVEEKANLRQKLNIPKDAIVVSYIGRKQEAKGYGRFLNAAKELVKTRDDLFFICVGPTPADAVKDINHKELVELESKMALSGRLISSGPLGHAALSNIYKATDIVYFPTSFGGEQHPVVGVEAIASGCVLVATKFAGIVETIEDNKTGFLIEYPPREDEGLARLQYAIEHIESLSDMRKKARDFAVNTFSWDVVAAELDNVFRSIY